MIRATNQNGEVIYLLYLVRGITAVLFGNYDLTSKIDIANTIYTESKKVFDGDPVFFPIPVDAPPEIPRIILTSKDQHYRCNVAATRLELLYSQRDHPGKELDDLKEEYLTILQDIAELVRGKLNVKVNRLGFILTAITFTEDPVELIKKHFIRDNTLMNPNQLELHVLRKLPWDDIEVNNWCRLSSQELKEPKGVKKALAVDSKR